MFGCAQAVDRLCHLDEWSDFSAALDRHSDWGHEEAVDQARGELRMDPGPGESSDGYVHVSNVSRAIMP
jgi:hypothetical protein